MADKKVLLHNSAGDNLYPKLNVDQIYPIGSIYITTAAANPATLFGGTWEKIGAGRALMGASSDSQLGKTVESGLPDIQGRMHSRSSDYNTGQIIWSSGGTNAFAVTGQAGNGSADTLHQQSPYTVTTDITFKASQYNSIYGRSSIVQPPAFYVNFWLRTV